MHQEEYATHIEEMEDTFAVQRVEVEFSESALFGDTDMTDVDAAASVDRYAALLRNALREHYRDCDTEITVCCGIDDKHLVDGDAGSDEAIEIGEVVHQIWDDWGWIVKKCSSP